MAFWFTFSGVPDDPNDPLNYTAVGSQPTTCTGTNQICAIYANNASGNPVITNELKSDMLIALSNREDIPGKVLLRA